MRSSIQDEEQRARISAVYAALSALTVPFLVFVIPRFYFSLHPEPVLNRAGKLEMDTIMLYVLLAAVGACTALFWGLLRMMVASKEKSA